MRWVPGARNLITINGNRLECCAWGGDPASKPTIVLLHEGLGSIGLWKRFPELLAERTGYCVFAYSRLGYGQSDPRETPWPLDFMSHEATGDLPAVLDTIGFNRGILLGHSDGASIAAIYAGSVGDRRIRGLCLLSPHFFTEPMGLSAIAETRTNGILPEALARHHRDPAGVLEGWSGVWLHPEFKRWNIEDAISYIRVPILAIQGLDDQYGTLRQIEALESGAYAPVDAVLLENCKHSPQFDQPERTLEAITDFVKRLDRIEAAPSL